VKAERVAEAKSGAAVRVQPLVYLQPANHEPWCLRQTKRWARLEVEGWLFGKPAIIHPGTVAIEMTRGAERCGAYVSDRYSFRELHTKLLEACERIAHAS
jgi:hypothetical protein